MSAVSVPETTFTKEYLPYWSDRVLKTKAAGGAVGIDGDGDCLAVLILGLLGGHVGGQGSEIHDGLQQHLNAQAGEGRAAEHGGHGALPDAGLQALGRSRRGCSSIAVEELLHELLARSPATASMSSASEGSSTSSATAAGMAQETVLPPLTS